MAVGVQGSSESTPAKSPNRAPRSSSRAARPRLLSPRQWERSRSWKQESQLSGRTAASMPRVSMKLCGLPGPGARCPPVSERAESCKKFLDRARQRVFEGPRRDRQGHCPGKLHEEEVAQGGAQTRSTPRRSVKAHGSASTGVSSEGSDRCFDLGTRRRSRSVEEREVDGHRTFCRFDATRSHRSSGVARVAIEIAI